MTELQAIEAIYQRWEDGWDVLHPTAQADPNHVPYTYRNETFDKSSLGVLGAWARVKVSHTAREQITQGGAPHRQWECRGFVSVDLFAPPNTGVALLAELAGHARTVLEGMRIDDLNLHEGDTRELDEKGDWCGSKVSVRFDYIETR